MELPRKIGIGIVMLVPAFVGSGALWSLFHSFIPVVIWLILTGLAAGAIITGNIPSGLQGRGFLTSSKRDLEFG